MSALASLLFATGGFAALSLTMTRHVRQVGTGAAMMPPPRWRAAGWIALALSLVIAVATPDWHFALVQWLGLLALAAGLVVLLLWSRPALLPKATAAAWVAAAVLSLALFL